MRSLLDLAILVAFIIFVVLIVYAGVQLQQVRYIVAR
jgi:hypothetical protein